MTKREKEILLAIRDGARVQCPSFCHRTYRLLGLPVTSTIGETFNRPTMDNLKAKGYIKRGELILTDKAIAELA